MQHEFISARIASIQSAAAIAIAHHQTSRSDCARDRCGWSRSRFTSTVCGSKSLGFESVYWYQLRAQSVAFAAFFFATSIVLWVMFRLVIPSSKGPRRPLLEISGQTIFLPGLDNVRSLARPVSVLIGVFLGLVFSSEWMTFALYLNRPAADAVADPIFGHSVSFYLFTLPMLDVVGGWVLALSVIVMLPAMILSVADSTAKFRGISIGLAFLLAAVAVQTYISRFKLLLDDHSLFSGVSYVDDKVLAPALALTSAALLLGAVISLLNIASGRIRNLIVAIAIPAATYAVAGVVIPAYETTFVVRPNELVKRNTIHPEQHSPHQKSVRSRSCRGCPVRSEIDERHFRSGPAPGDTGQYPAVGLARASGHPAATSGDPDLLRFPRCRRRSLHHRRKAS